MNESLHTEGPEDAKSNESRRRQTLTLAAAVAVLGMSLGGDVQELLAADSGETLKSDQVKKDRESQGKQPTIQERGVSGGYSYSKVNIDGGVPPPPTTSRPVPTTNRPPSTGRQGTQP